MIPFAYRPGTTFIHHLDVRVKFVIICMLSICLVPAGILPSLLYMLILATCFSICRLNLARMLWQMKFFLMLLGFVFVSRWLTTPGDPLLSAFGITATKQGAVIGFLVTFKFLLVMTSGLLFCTTTRPSQVKGAVQWFLKPIPLIPEKRVAVMVSLSLAFMPVILKQAQKISDAQAARCGHLEKNPVKKIIRLVLPMMKKTFLSADSLALAMESRCYADDRTDPEFIPSGKEAYFLLAAGTLAAVLIFA